MDGVGLFEALLDAADLAMDVDINVSPRRDSLLVQDRRARLHGEFRVENRGEKLVLDFE